MTIELRIAKKDDIEEWNRLVERSPHGTIFHTWNWLKVVEEYTNCKLYPIIGYKGTTPVGVYPLFYSKKGFVRLVFSPPPKALLLYLGPVFTDYNKLKQSRRESLFTEFQTEVNKFIASELGANYIRVRTSPGLLDSRPLKWTGYEVQPLYTYVIDLTKGVEGLWKELNRKLRVSIERSRREGVTVEIGGKEDLEYLRRALYSRFKEQGLKPQKDYYKNYLYNLYELYHPENMKVFIARYNEERVGGLVVLCYKDWSALWIGIPKTDLTGIYPNDLAQWEAIKWACEQGYKYYEEMDAGDDPRLRHFKAKFNPELVPWYSAVKCSPWLRIAEKIVKTVF